MDPSSEKPRPKTLLQKYEIPVEFLDFTYINNCTDTKMIERIVKILRSGEEGYYPDLTKCAEKKLKELKPNSKMFRVEEAIMRHESLDDEKKINVDNDMKCWIDEMKKQDDVVKNILRQPNKNEPPVRCLKGEEKNKNYSQNSMSKRIKSTDYEKWDKFDADAAELKVDLDEERQREKLESERNKKVKGTTKLIEEIDDELSEFEKNRMAIKFKEQGNEAFKAKDYEEAIREYSKSIEMKRNAAAYNNRALVYLKQKCYLKVISDTNECLQMEPRNIKALLRKAQAFLGQNLLTQAHDTFEKVLQIDSNNDTAQKEILELKKKLPSFVKNSSKMNIEEIDEIDEKKSKKIIKSEKLDFSEQKHVPKLVQNIIQENPIFSELKPRENSLEKEELVLPSHHIAKNKNSKNEILIREVN